MILGDSAVGNTTVGFSKSQVDLSFSATSTSAATLTATAGYNLSYDSTATSSSAIYRTVNLSASPTVETTNTFASTKGVNLSLQRDTNNLGDTTLGSSAVGSIDDNFTSQTSLFSDVTKGRTVSFGSSATTGLDLFKRIDLTLQSATQSSSEWAVFKGVSVQFQSTTESTAVFVPDFDEIIGRTRADGTRNIVERADGERVFIIQATGNID